MGKLISPPEFTFDFRPTFTASRFPNTITRFLDEMGLIGGESERVLKLEDLVSRLESEIKKIDAFKRELPLCMLLMNDAIGALKEELIMFKKPVNQPVLEEFIPLKKTSDEDPQAEKTDGDDKKNWLSSTQLWNVNQTRNPKQNSTEQAVEKVVQEPENRMIDDSFKGCYSFLVGDKEEAPVSGLSLVTPGIKNPVKGNMFFNKVGDDGDRVRYSVPHVRSDIQITPQPQQPPQPQTSRKQRRCWSTELHRRFVNALQQLGGSKAATPKQIRELMRVDGLTNDEVKSHLQKYRLHTKKFPSCNTPSNPSNVVLGGLWGQTDDHHAEKHLNSQSGSPDGPLLHCTTGGTSTTGGDSMDDGEDEKSENNCWKSHPHTSGKDNV